jgi:hypothetical protein
MSRDYSCENCNGIGIVRHVEWRSCPICRGHGAITRAAAMKRCAIHAIEAVKYRAVGVQLAYSKQAQKLGDARLLSLAARVVDCLERYRETGQPPVVDEYLIRAACPARARVARRFNARKKAS